VRAETSMPRTPAIRGPKSAAIGLVVGDVETRRGVLRLDTAIPETPCSDKMAARAELMPGQRHKSLHIET
jgi:hypothetical protein